MPQTDELKAALTDALRSKETHRVETLRGLLSGIHNEEIAKRTKGGEGELSDAEVAAVLQREAKKRSESAEIYGKAGRNDLAEKELAELAIITAYLPPALDRSEIEALVDEVIAGGASDFGKIMGAVMPKVAGRADAREVTAVVKERLDGGQ